MPLMLKSKSEPTPPSSRIFTPAVRSTRLLSELMLLATDLMSMALTEKAPSRNRWVFDLPVTVTLSNVIVSFDRLFLLGVWAPTYKHDRQTIINNSLLMIIIVRNNSTWPYSRGFCFVLFVTWQVSWLSPKSLPSQFSQWLF